MKKIVLIFLSVISLFSSFSQTSVWKVSKDGNELYLGGTVHVLSASCYPLPEEFQKAYNKSEMLVFEADIDELANPSIAQEMMKRAIFTDNRTLKSVLSEETYNELSKQLLKVSLPIENVEKFKPGMVILTLSAMKMAEMTDFVDGVDKYFLQKAKEDKKELDYFESTEYQIDLIANMGEGNEDQFVRYSIQDLDNMQKDISALITTWKDGSGLEAIIELKQMKAEYPDLYKSMIVDRNNNWMVKIEKYLSDNKIEFVLVGAAHYYGEDGLIQQLKNKGYKVEQLDINMMKE